MWLVWPQPHPTPLWRPGSKTQWIKVLMVKTKFQLLKYADVILVFIICDREVLLDCWSDKRRTEENTLSHYVCYKLGRFRHFEVWKSPLTVAQVCFLSPDIVLCFFFVCLCCVVVVELQQSDELSEEYTVISVIYQTCSKLSRHVWLQISLGLSVKQNRTVGKRESQTRWFDWLAKT